MLDFLKRNGDEIAAIFAVVWLGGLGFLLILVFGFSQ